jgi:alkylation response protein AidB-like acyl-CoA dehydrogenase
MLDTQLRHWLDEHAEALDLGQLDAEQVLPQLAQAGLLRLGVPTALGGSGGSILDAVEAVAQVASHSLTAAFVFWGQRSFIEFLLQSDNAGLRERLLGDLLSGRLAGASGLSNAMKHLCGIEQLGISSQAQDGGWWLEGRLPWVTNLRKAGFVVAAAIEQPGAEPFIAAIDSDLPGLSRSDDLQLLGMQSSNTAALVLNQVSFKREALIASQAKPFLARVRPAFLGLQCAMGLGLARRALQEAEAHLKGHRTVLSAELEALQAR